MCFFLFCGIKKKKAKGIFYMETKFYFVLKIEGEYATLKEEGSDGNEVFIALALLPLGATIGSKLHFEMLEYTLVD